MDRVSIRPPYERQRWNSSASDLKAWQRGNTGFPLVDAAMRQLWRVGWMNNYMRHVVASFLVSYLHISWVKGEFVCCLINHIIVPGVRYLKAVRTHNGVSQCYGRKNFHLNYLNLVT